MPKHKIDDKPTTKPVADIQHEGKSYTAFSLMTQDDAETHVRLGDPTVRLECATGRIYGTYYDGRPILLAGCYDWQRALQNLGTRIPELNSFGVYTFTPEAIRKAAGC